MISLLRARKYPVAAAIVALTLTLPVLVCAGWAWTFVRTAP